MVDVHMQSTCFPHMSALLTADKTARLDHLLIFVMGLSA